MICPTNDHMNLKLIILEPDSGCFDMISLYLPSPSISKQAPSKFMQKKHITIKSANRRTESGPCSKAASVDPAPNRKSSVEQPKRPMNIDESAKYLLLYPFIMSRSEVTPIKGFNAKGVMIIVMYSCCLAASIPRLLNNGNPTLHINVMMPPY